MSWYTIHFFSTAERNGRVDKRSFLVMGGVVAGVNDRWMGDWWVVENKM